MQWAVAALCEDGVKILAIPVQPDLYPKRVRVCFRTGYLKINCKKY